MSFTTLAPAPTPPAAPALPAEPDRLALWPLGDGRYGLDLQYEGSWACEDAEQTARCLSAHRMSGTLRPGERASWSLRLGPLSSLQVAEALESLLATSPH